MKGFIVFTAFLYLLTSSNSLADENLYNPLLSYREQLKILRRDCNERKYDQDCARLEKKLEEEMEQLKTICKSNPYDERCGAVMKEKKETNGFQMFCQENPHAKKCVVKRVRARRREKMKRLYCSKNPDASRCQNKTIDKNKKGFAFYCKVHPDDRRCKVYLERKMIGSNKAKEPDTNSF